VEVASTPEAYAAYVRGSRGEFSCVKPSCLKLRNAWVSDRTLCYLASGKPVVVQDTGQGAFLPTGEGAFLFSTLDEAAEAFGAINADYERHCRAARAIAEEHFHTRRTAETILNAGQAS
jgi:glycosyltransferase involved in cell wall biosynthesis